MILDPAANSFTYFGSSWNEDHVSRIRMSLFLYLWDVSSPLVGTGSYLYLYLHLWDPVAGTFSFRFLLANLFSKSQMRFDV